MSAHGASAQPLSRFAVSPERRRRDALARTAILGATILALIPLVLIVYYLLHKGLGSWSTSFFTTDPTGDTFFKNSNIGGIKSAILGTLEIVAIASAMAIPVGICVAIWLVEYGRGSRFASIVRFAVDVLTGEELLLSRGPVVEAVMASAAIPAVLPPVFWEGRTLMDGGVANNTPISHAVALGARVIEKHFTSDKSWVGPDVPISIDPAELRDLIQGSRAIFAAPTSGATITGSCNALRRK